MPYWRNMVPVMEFNKAAGFVEIYGLWLKHYC